MTSIPNSPEELLRQHEESKKECQCLICKVRRVIEDEIEEAPAQATVQLSMAFLALSIDKFEKSVVDSMKARVIPYSLAMANLQGQTMTVLDGLSAVNRRLDDLKELWNPDD